MKGTVKFFNRQRGWGFITGEDGNEYYVHYTDITGEGFRELRDDQEVTFTLRDTERGKECTDVEKV